MWRNWLQWVRGLFAHPRDEIEPHPRMESDQGERDHVEKAMDEQSMHAGPKP